MCLFLIHIYNLCQSVGPSLKFEWDRLVSPRFEWTLRFERSPRIEGITLRSPRIECFTYFWGWSSTWSTDSGAKWAECSLNIGTGCWVQVFSLILDSSVGLSASWIFSLLANWCLGPRVQILHSAEEHNLSPFDLNIACLCQSIEINNNKHVYYGGPYESGFVLNKDLFTNNCEI